MAHSQSYTVRRKTVTFLQDQQSEEFTSDAMDNGEADDNTTSVPDTTSVDYTPFNEDDFTDIALKVDDEMLYTNRSLLAFASPVFSCMFTADFKEKMDKVWTIGISITLSENKCYAQYSLD